MSIERISGITGEKDRREVIETFARAFTNPTWMEGHMERSLFRGPVFDPEHTRVTIAGGRVVAAVTMAPRMIRFGPVSVPAVTVGPVGTHDQHRRRGYAAAAMNDACRYMAENGILLGYLQGIPNFYYRFGYYPYMAPSTVKFGREEARKVAGKGTLRAMKRADLPEVRRIFDRTTAGRTCASERDDGVWQWLMGPGTKTWLFGRPRVIVDGEGEICGYTTVSPGHWGIRGEVIVRQDEDACRAALGALVRDARRNEQKEIVLPVPWDDALGVFIRQFVAAEWRMTSNPTGGAVMRIADFPALMERLQPMFEQRWREAQTSLPPVEFSFSCELGKVGFRIGRNGVAVGTPSSRRQVKVPQRWLSGLLTGYYTPADIAERDGCAIPGKLTPYLEILFPAGWPFVYQGDNY
jgi:predicted N-acetyltransferase YhbS